MPPRRRYKEHQYTEAQKEWIYGKRNKFWARKWLRCQCCGLTDSPHKARGLCNACVTAFYKSKNGDRYRRVRNDNLNRKRRLERRKLSLMPSDVKVKLLPVKTKKGFDKAESL